MQEKEKSAGTGQKKKWFQGLQSEFKKIYTFQNGRIHNTDNHSKNYCNGNNRNGLFNQCRSVHPDNLLMK